MSGKRYRELMMYQDLKLTSEEMDIGWHFCNEYDGMLVGPEMKNEWENCLCCEKKQFESKQPTNKPNL